MNNEYEEIRNMVNKETKAWDEQDVESLLELFHKDMVWPWPKTNNDHNPMNWEITQGKYDYKRWKEGWEILFRENILIMNERKILKIELSKENDGAFAVVDINTRWENRIDHSVMNWKGRVCKVYSKCNDGWKITMHTGVLEY
jgi:ketosteroid isomerase-like protein